LTLRYVSSGSFFGSSLIISLEVCLRLASAVSSSQTGMERLRFWETLLILGLKLSLVETADFKAQTEDDFLTCCRFRILSVLGQIRGL
jgi:hypothetical protein